MRSWCSTTRSGPTSAKSDCARPWTSTPGAAGDSARDDVMSPLVSRIVVAAILLPLVIGLVYLGGWWLFGLALVGGLFALHELYVMTRVLRPLVLGGYLGYAAMLLGLQLGGVEWML